jgi:hypothetical protein
VAACCAPGKLELDIPAGGVVMPSARLTLQQRDEKHALNWRHPSALELMSRRLTLPAQPAGTKLSIEGKLVYISQPKTAQCAEPRDRTLCRSGQFSLRDG